MTMITNLLNTILNTCEPEVDYDIAPTKLFQLIESSEWSDVIKHATKYHDEVETWVRRNDDFHQGKQLWRVLPIHAAIINQAPSDVIDTLIEIYPDGCSERDDQDNLPLHLACNNLGLDDDVICALLEGYPESVMEDNPNGLSLVDYDRNCSRLYKLIQAKEWTRARKRAKVYQKEVKSWVLRMECGKVRWRLLPIHGAIIFDAPKELVISLIKAFPESTRCIDDEGMTPLQRELNKDKHNDEIIRILVKAMAYPHGIIAYSEGGNNHKQDNSNSSSPSSKDKNKNNSTLADYDKNCPHLYKLIEKKSWDMVMSRVTTNPEETQTWVMKKKENGTLLFRHLPLHFVLTQNPPTAIVEAILTGYIDAIRCCDDQGLVPLQIGIEHFEAKSEVVTVLREALEHPSRICMKDPKGNVLMCDYDRNPPKLYSLLEERDWKDCMERSTMYPEEARTWVMRKQLDGTLRWRLLPIHAAIIFKAPRNVVQNLLFAYPEGAKCRDDQGMLPYHLAKWKKSPQHIIDTLRNAFPDAVTMIDHRSPLALNHSATLKRKTGYTNKRRRQLQQQCDDDEDTVLSSRQAEEVGPIVICDYDLNPPSLFKLIEAKRWNEAEVYVRECPNEASNWIRRRNRNGSIKWRLLPIHAAVIFQAPSHIIQSLLKAYPEGAKCRDDQGMLPLHLATWAKPRNNDVIQTLIKGNPEGFKEKDAMGRTPGDMFLSSSVGGDGATSPSGSSASSGGSRTKISRHSVYAK